MSESAFIEQLRNNQGIIYKLVGLYAADQEEKKDLYQEIVLQAWKGWPAFRKEAKFSTWLYRICLNTIFTQQRKKKSAIAHQPIDTQDKAAVNYNLQQEETERLRKAMRQLEETDRAIISMHLDGYNNTEIKEVMGISLNHVSVKLHRIKHQLANFLNNDL